MAYAMQLEHCIDLETCARLANIATPPMCRIVAFVQRCVLPERRLPSLLFAEMPNTEQEIAPHVVRALSQMAYFPLLDADAVTNHLERLLLRADAEVLQIFARINRPSLLLWYLPHIWQIFPSATATSFAAGLWPTLSWEIVRTALQPTSRIDMHFLLQKFACPLVPLETPAVCAKQYLGYLQALSKTYPQLQSDPQYLSHIVAVALQAPLYPAAEPPLANPLCLLRARSAAESTLVLLCAQGHAAAQDLLLGSPARELSCVPQCEPINCIGEILGDETATPRRGLAEARALRAAATSVAAVLAVLAISAADFGRTCTAATSSAAAVAAVLALTANQLRLELTGTVKQVLEGARSPDAVERLAETVLHFGYLPGLLDLGLPRLFVRSAVDQTDKHAVATCVDTLDRPELLLLFRELYKTSRVGLESTPLRLVALQRLQVRLGSVAASTFLASCAETVEEPDLLHSEHTALGS